MFYTFFSTIFDYPNVITEDHGLTSISAYVSRWFYILLVLTIILCLVVTSIQNKFEGKSYQKLFEGQSWGSFWTNYHSMFPISQFKADFFNELDNDHVIFKTRLKNADDEITTLKNDLDSATFEKNELENTIEEYKRQKMESEGELFKLKNDRLKLETLKKEVEMTGKKLQIAIQERDNLSRQIESMARLDKLNKSVLQDHINLKSHFEKAETEIESLKVALDDTKAERDLAISLLSDMIDKTKGSSPDERERGRIAIQRMIEEEVKRLRTIEDKIEMEVEEELDGFKFNIPLRSLFFENVEEVESKYTLKESELIESSKESSISIVRSENHLMIVSPGSSEGCETVHENDKGQFRGWRLSSTRDVYETFGHKSILREKNDLVNEFE